jgi:hypothetical protein
MTFWYAGCERSDSRDGFGDALHSHVRVDRAPAPGVGSSPALHGIVLKIELRFC